MLSPRFYTTDFDAMDRLDMSSVRADWDKMMAEYEGDNNHDHFQRDAQFADEVAQRFSQVSPEMRQEFLDFLISSLTSEFSGCTKPRYQTAHAVHGTGRVPPCQFPQSVAERLWLGH
jgi:magnesium-protoporphyrin IX monomethyl ester (oxidative) cyclase